MAVGNKVGLVAAGSGLLILLAYLRSQRKKTFLDKKRKWAKIAQIIKLSHDTKLIRISLGGASNDLGLPTGKHIKIFAPNPSKRAAAGQWNGRDDEEKGKAEIERKYTPCTGNETLGHVDLVIKVYRPGVVKMPDGREMNWTDGGKMSLYLDGKQEGDSIEIDGPLGANEYLGCGVFKLPGRKLTVKHVCMMSGGTGLTPMLQVVQASLQDSADTCKFTLLLANKTEDDILCRELLEAAEKKSNGRFKLHYTLDFPPEGWKHKTGFISKEMIQEVFPAPSEDVLVLMCGPPPMVKFACKANLEALGYEKQLMAEF